MNYTCQHPVSFFGKKATPDHQCVLEILPQMSNPGCQSWSCHNIGFFQNVPCKSSCLVFPAATLEATSEFTFNWARIVLSVRIISSTYLPHWESVPCIFRSYNTRISRPVQNHVYQVVETSRRRKRYRLWRCLRFTISTAELQKFLRWSDEW